LISYLSNRLLKDHLKSAWFTYSVGWFPESVCGSEPPPSWHHVPVDEREDFFLKPVKFLLRLRLVLVEAGLGFTSILKLTEKELSVANENRARSVPIVGCLSVDLAQLFKDVLHEDWGLTEDSGSCFRSWQIADITMTKDV